MVLNYIIQLEIDLPICCLYKFYIHEVDLIIEILQNHRSVLDTFNIPMSGMNEFELPYLCWTPKLHKNPYKHRYIAGSSKCSTKPLFLLLTNILTDVKEKLQTFCATTYAISGVNQMWILEKILKNF
jgi:hypothetical protein